MKRRREEPDYQAMKHSEFARRFRETCIEVGAPLKQEDLGKFLKVSGTMAWNYLNGEKLPSMDTAIQIAGKLGVCVEWLLTGRGPKYPGGPTEDLSKEDIEAAKAMARLPSRERAMIQAALHASEKQEKPELEQPPSCASGDG